MNTALPPPSEALRELARLHGVHTSYLDMAKRRRVASEESLLAVLRALGAPVEEPGDAASALAEERRARARQVLEPIQVAWRGRTSNVTLRLPDSAAVGPLVCEWRLEDGSVLRTETRLELLPARRVIRAGGVRFTARLLSLPARLPPGYHRLIIECGPGRFETQVFSAPIRCFQNPSPSRRWGVFAPLHALHSARSWGAGDFGDLATFIDWVSVRGGRFVGTLPLLPAFLDEPCEPSPYSPASRLLWNEFYLDLERVPELAACPLARRRMGASSFQSRLETLRADPHVDYARLMALKRHVLEALSDSFFARSSSLRGAFEAFLAEHPVVADYASFRAYHEQRGEPWTRWPARTREGGLRESDCRQSIRRYHLYAQWLAHEQMGELSDHARRRGVDLYLDMPLGTHRDGYDTWRHSGAFALDASGGAPPDPVFTQGQDWGFAPIHPQRSREQGHAYVRAYLRHHLRHARMLRFDHVMGLHRLYWVPCGLPASQGAYITYPAEEFYAMLSIESHRHRAIIVGEDLGTVPPEVNRSLDRHGVAGMFVVQYEARPHPRSALRRIPPRRVASINTHDMPPFAAFWKGLDIADRHDLGLIPRKNLPGDYRLRERIRRSLRRLVPSGGRRKPGVSDTGAVFRAILERLGASAARWVLVNLEDLWQETESQNTPGTTTERINWRRKTRFRLGEFESDGGREWLLALEELDRVRGRRRRVRAAAARTQS